MRDKYAPLVERVSDRAELNDVLAIMVSEVASLHSQIRPGDVRRAPADGSPAALGAVLSKVLDGYRIDHIYRSEPDLPSQRGPLDSPDLDVKPGDVITAVNGKSVLKLVIFPTSCSIKRQASAIACKRGNRRETHLDFAPSRWRNMPICATAIGNKAEPSASTKRPMVRSVTYICAPWTQ